MHQIPRVPQGKCIKKGQVLADGAATVSGELAMGKNVVAAPEILFRGVIKKFKLKKKINKKRT